MRSCHTKFAHTNSSTLVISYHANSFLQHGPSLFTITGKLKYGICTTGSFCTIRRRRSTSPPWNITGLGFRFGYVQFCFLTSSTLPRGLCLCLIGPSCRFNLGISTSTSTSTWRLSASALCWWRLRLRLWTSNVACQVLEAKCKWREHGVWRRRENRQG